MDEIRKILVATDGSEYTKEAVSAGLHLAKILGAEVTALYVIDQTSFVSFPIDSSIVSVYSLLENEGKRAVEEVKKEGEQTGVKVSTVVVEGSPTRKIVEMAADFDLVVIGTLGRSALSKLFMGSVAERVTRYAPCPVLVVRSKKR
ncbi:MAG: universal stress protein [Thermoplasmatota archaeon]|nr:universal stress protein [Candidatus Thermoplasmatota archaeon]MBU1913577.1 universal stress protein [Candidatus Thermoplasmatota archaeon]